MSSRIFPRLPSQIVIGGKRPKILQYRWHAPEPEAGHLELMLRYAKIRGAAVRMVRVLSPNLRGKLDLHNKPYEPSCWVFCDIPKTELIGK